MARHNNFLLAVFLWNSYSIIKGLFTVQVKRSHYIAEYGSNISMECQFTVDVGTHVEDLSVLWKHSRDTTNGVEVVKYINGKDIEVLQGKNYSARMKLLSNELHNGRAILHISKVQMTDAGQYFCIISSHGSDYKVMNLEVEAPYRKITTQVIDVVNASGETVKEVSCQSFGYPEAQVTWMMDRENLTAVHNISYILTTDGLFSVTSVVRVPATSNRTVTCTFWNQGTHNVTSLTFIVSENVKNDKSQEWKFSFAILTILILVVFSLMLAYVSRRHKRSYQISLHDRICTNETAVIPPNMSSTRKYSTEHMENKSEDTIVDAENTVTRLLNS